MILDKTQLQIQKEIAESTGYITVTCGNCGDVHFQESKELVYTCPSCAYEGDPCNFPDLYS